MEPDEYKTITKNSEGLYKEKGSKFISLAFPVKNEKQIKEILEVVRKQYHDARHHCYAYKLGHEGDVYRINDDGEPSGTAGKPIYGQILSWELTDVLIIVIRYFGGTKLGVSGLITAYKTAAKDALEQALIVCRTVDDCFELNFEYPLMNEVMRLLKEYNLKPLKQEFEMACKIIFRVRKSSSLELQEKFLKINGVKIKNVDIC